jgi:hypothetical protein
MKKAFLAIIIVSLIFASSCKKTGSSAIIGTWMFRDTTYTAVSAQGTVASNTLTAANGSTTHPSTLNFIFGSYPTAGGTYQVVGLGGSATGNYVTLQMVNGTNSYSSTGRDGAQATVTVSAAGKVGVQVNSVEVINQVIGTDSAAIIYVTVNQQ